MRAPVHGLLALVDHVLVDELSERAHDRRLVFEFERLVRVVPRADDAEPLEVFALNVDVLLSVRTAGAAEIRGAHLLLLRPELAIDLELDRQSMAVPSRNVR